MIDIDPAGPGLPTDWRPCFRPPGESDTRVRIRDAAPGLRVLLLALLPAQDVAKAGAWETIRMVEEVYTQADEETTLSVVLH